MKLNFVASEEERFTYNEAAHEARMTMSEWIRQVLNDAADGHHVVEPLSKSVPAKSIMVPVSTSSDYGVIPADALIDIESLKKSGLLFTGKDIALPPRTIPRWADEDTKEIAYNRELLFGKNPLRLLSKKEADFNKLCKVRGQRYNEDGTPRLDLNGDYIPVD